MEEVYLGILLVLVRIIFEADVITSLSIHVQANRQS